MSKLKYARLFEPLEIAGEMFRNRIFSAPQGFYNIGADNLPNHNSSAFFERKAMGGAASVCVGDCIVDAATGTHYPFLIRMEDQNTLPGLSATASAITRHGAVAAAELSHAGMYAQFSKFAEGKPLFGPVADPYGKYGEVEEMPEEIILQIIQSFGKAAAWAKRCGFGMVTIHGGHGWMLAQFMSPFVNTRKDMWGGSFENRMRFPLAVIKSIRDTVGKRFPIEMRISGSECISEGYGLEEGIKIAKALDGVVDIIHVSAGHHEYDKATIISHPSMFLPDGVNVKYAAEIKKHVKTHVATVGALTDPAMMEEIIASGQADIVELGRQTLADPDLPIKARTGRDNEINKCMRCNACFANIMGRRTPRCAINPVIGHEFENKFAAPTVNKKKVLVAGGGIGGMQAALTASRQGHEVILCEKGSKLGGALLCESEIPFKKRLGEYIDRQIMLISREHIEVKLNSEVTPDVALQIAPDAIIAALGARPDVPAIPGIDSGNVYCAEELYKSPDKAKGKIVIIGGGLVGLELGVFMRGRGHEITIVEIQDELTVPESMHTLALMNEIGRLDIGVHVSTKVIKITPSGVLCAGPEGEKEFSADTIAYATGQIPLRREAFALSGCASEFYQIGDCVTPKNIIDATQAAYTIARDIGSR